MFSLQQFGYFIGFLWMTGTAADAQVGGLGSRADWLITSYFCHAFLA
jgi:hypothetical protein